jgi:hypothetical protein
MEARVKTTLKPMTIQGSILVQATCSGHTHGHTRAFAYDGPHRCGRHFGNSVGECQLVGEWLDQSACADPVVSWVGMRAVLRGHDVSATFHVYCNKLSQGAKRKLK